MIWGAATCANLGLGVWKHGVWDRRTLINFVVFVLGGIILWRLAQVGLVVEDRGITVHQLLRDRRADWGGIERFAVRKYSAQKRLFQIELRNGKSYRAYGFSPGDPKQRGQIEEIKEQLNRRLASSQ